MNEKMSEAVYDLNRAIVMCGIPHYTVELLVQSLRYFDSNADGATRFIVDAQREAYRRTQSPRGRVLAESLRAERQSKKRGEAHTPAKSCVQVKFSEKIFA
ncbi:MAG: hypothetical protein LBF55_06505 [Prevotellaceae bacterium]|jgi:hypothetical protein|nr:hypothetical protein [Prevotellaceae bacterium]